MQVEIELREEKHRAVKINIKALIIIKIKSKGLYSLIYL